MAVRLKDIADELQLSVVTVSKVLQNYRDVNAETRRRVLQKAQELGYRPNYVARSLVKQRSATIGMVLPHLRHTFFQEVYQAIAAKASPKGYSLLIALSQEDPDQEAREIDHMISRQVEGLILASTQPYTAGEFLEPLEKRNLPLLLLDREFAGYEAHFVGTDDGELGRLATAHLIEQGCTRIAHLRGPDVSTAIVRVEGYRAELAAHKLTRHPHYVAGGTGDDEAGYWAMKSLLKAKPPPDGVFCYNDPVAAGAMKAVLDSQLRVPEDVAIVGAGNMHYSDLFRVPLTTVDQRSAEVGAQAADLILALAERGSTALATDARRRRPTRVLVKPTMVIRESSRRKR
ncbi:MAG: substrate-binding domain-containing protein [Luteitalea sp.]|nr:substrate-binding domain-containing protein [Luteitalea sp.]